ncbi:MAG: DUF4080 domain-containing protein [Bacteroidaceae bacterium]|nr:DUF4080 domain-containing protein [Bacteroidaceae bacterium]
MKLVWIDLNCSYAHSSLALPALHAQVMGRPDVEWQVVRTTNNEAVGTTVDAVYACRPDVVAATAWLFTHEQLLHIIGRVKALMPGVKVILGGPEFLGDNEGYLCHHPEVDIVFRGEGEESFARWINVWNRPEEWAAIPGLCYMWEDEYHDGGLARVMNFDSLLPPEESPLFMWDKPFVQMETTRGCFNTCAFCVSGMGDPIRPLPLNAIRQRLCRIRERGIRDVRILDRTFNHRPLQAVVLLELFAEFHPHLRFHLEIHPALLPQSVREVLVSLPDGLLHLEAGIQSLRQEVLDMSRRKGRLEQALDGLRFLCSLPNLVTHADLIAGLPCYGLSQIYEDIRTLAAFQAGEIQLELLKLLPGTAMRRDAAELGIKYSPLPPYEVLETEAISSAQLQEVRRLSRLLDAYYNTSAWQSLTRRLIVEEDWFLHRFLDFLTENNYIDQPMSLERRGELLYIFCCGHYPMFVVEATVAWIEAGMSLRKRPAERVQRGHLQPPADWQVVYGAYDESLRLCYLPTGVGGEGYWFGYDSTSQRPAPIFKAVSKMNDDTLSCIGI